MDEPLSHLFVGGDNVLSQHRPATAPERRRAAEIIIAQLTAAGWHTDDIVRLLGSPSEVEDRLEHQPVIEFGTARLTPAEMRVEIRHILIR